MRSHGRSPIVLAICTLAASWCHSSDVLAQCDGSWFLRTPATSPDPRGGSAMTFDSTRGVAVLFGGQLTGNGLDASTFEWDGTNWVQLTPAVSPTARAFHAMAFDSTRGVTVLFGGGTGDGSVPNGETWEWDGINWSQKSPAVSPSPRNFHAMAFDASRGVTVLFGGVDNTNLAPNETWEWDGVNWHNRVPAAAPPPLAGHAMAYDAARGETVIFGGLLSPALPLNLSAETWIWNGTNWVQMLTLTTPAPRYFHAMSYDADRARVVLFGGAISAVPEFSAETWDWDGSTWFMRKPALSPSARFSVAMAYDTTRHVTVQFGGSNGMALINETWQWNLPTIIIDQQPASVVVDAGQSAAFTASASAGAVVLQHAWHRDGVPLTDGGAVSGATTPTLTINPASTTDAGTYTCEISHACLTVISDSAILTVNDLIVAQQNVPCGLCGTGATALMPLALLALGASTHRRKLQRRHARDQKERKVSAHVH